jgi:hypothetical protein
MGRMCSHDDLTGSVCSEPLITTGTPQFIVFLTFCVLGAVVGCLGCIWGNQLGQRPYFRVSFSAGGGAYAHGTFGERRPQLEPLTEGYYAGPGVRFGAPMLSPTS